MITSKDTYKAVIDELNRARKDIDNIIKEKAMYQAFIGDMTSPVIPTQKRWEELLNEWQLCPKCSGNGFIFYNSGNGELWFGEPVVNTTNKICDLCNGKKIISKVTGNPPQ